MARVKHVFSDEREIAHLWMARATDPEVQDNARNRQGNFYYSGDIIYSYGSHFPIARHVTGANGDRAVLFTTRGYSSTTSRHIYCVRRALDPAVPVFNVSGVDPQFVIEGYRRDIENVIQGVKERAVRKTKLKAMERIAEIVDEAHRYAVFAGRPEGAKYCRDHAADLERWRQTGSRELPDGRYLDLSRWPAALLRVDAGEGSGEGSGEAEVVTSLGARVPVAHAKRAWRFVRSIRAKGENWESNGHRFSIGHYSLDSVTAKGDIKAGCHVIEWPEIERLARQMGWSEEALTA